MSDYATLIFLGLAFNGHQLLMLIYGFLIPIGSKNLSTHPLMKDIGKSQPLLGDLLSLWRKRRDEK
jgi:hypothetical protein